ncbi:DUF4328 domain-containing protein [Streptoalloteichus hindustanus]|nr:DUF4328 domain-containing protein [Streptoalloteichus hindustanus]
MAPPLRAVESAPSVRMLPLRGLTVAVISLLGVWAFVALARMVVNIQRISLVGKVFDENAAVDSLAVDRNDTLHALTSLLQFATLIATGVVLVVWLFRARANAEAMVPAPHHLGRTWLVIGWLVPVVSLWFPKRIMDDIWRASHPNTPSTCYDLNLTNRPGLGYAWWAAWLLHLALDRVVSRLLRSESLESLRLAAIIEANATPIGLVAATSLALLVWRVKGFQEQRQIHALNL